MTVKRGLQKHSQRVLVFGGDTWPKPIRVDWSITLSTSLSVKEQVPYACGEEARSCEGHIKKNIAMLHVAGHV